VGKNVDIYRDIVPRIERVAPDAIVLILSNPVDVLTYATLTLRVFPGAGIRAGTILDTSRFRHELGRLCNVDPRNVHAYVIGEHGDFRSTGMESGERRRNSGQAQLRGVRGRMHAAGTLRQYSRP